MAAQATQMIGEKVWQEKKARDKRLLEETKARDAAAVFLQERWRWLRHPRVGSCHEIVGEGAALTAKLDGSHSVDGALSATAFAGRLEECCHAMTGETS